MSGDRPKPHEVVLLSIVGLLVDVFFVILIVVVILIITPESSGSSPLGAGT
jgi:hypothetical protein